ncbi:metallochaperone AztD [Falsirhodobacter xinxiangensis]|uniref:metallochaperone AztD n=1 Tax=Falsirhodobacter xinxiangensis TaxID=2530049 RepID=UPI0010AAB667|nr:metallochaperone AztD [Rhodobacter xinxiangensis]
MTFRWLLSAAALAASPALADDTHTAFRVFVADHGDAGITAFDLEGDGRWTFPTVGQAKLYPAANGAALVAVQSDDETVSFLNSGITLTSHGDHSDISVADPSAIDGTLTGPRPFHVVNHDGQTVINFDQGGYAAILPQSALATGKVEPTEFRQSRAHHGFVTPFDGVTLSTVASDATDGPRLGLQAFDAKGDPMGEVATCTGIHGEAFSGSFLAAGCNEGVLTVQESGDGPRFAMLPYPADFPEGKTGTLLGSTSIQMFLGNFGADGLVVIDPVDEPHFRHVKLPFRRVDFALDPARPGAAYILTEDGSLHRLNMLDARIEDSAKVTGPYSMEGHWNDARPRLAVAGGSILVTDPAKGAVQVVDAETLDVARAVEIGGQPYNIAVVGGSGLSH